MKKLASLGTILIISLFLTGCSVQGIQDNLRGRVSEILVIDPTGTYAKLADTNLAFRIYGTSKYLGLMGKNELRFYDNDNSNYVGLRATTTISANKVWDMPLTDGTNGQVLTTDGNGQFSFSSATGLSPTGNFLGTWDSLATSSFLSSYSNFLGTWDGLATTSFISSYGSFYGLWDGYATNTLPYLSNSLSYLLKSASTSIPGLISSASSTAWNALQYSKKGWADFSNTATGLTYNNTTGATSWTAGYEGMLTSNKNEWNALELASTTKIGLTNLSSTFTGLTYTNTTGVFSATAGYSIPLTASTTKWNAFQQASTTFFGGNGSALALTANSYVIGNANGKAEATTTINLLTKAFSVASSTYFFSAGSSTIPLGYQFYQDTWTSIACKFIGGNTPTAHMICGDGTNNMERLNINGTMASTTLSTNNVLQIKDQAQCVLEAVANAPDMLTCNIAYRRD
jgi:hypothetical protein